jgi:hypothetical protein
MNDPVLLAVLVLLVVAVALLCLIAAVNVGNLVVGILALRNGHRVIDWENEIDWENVNEKV